MVIFYMINQKKKIKKKKKRKIQYKACLAVTGAIQGSQKLYDNFYISISTFTISRRR